MLLLVLDDDVMTAPSTKPCRALGPGLSNVKYFSEASSAAERVQEVIQRVPKIDSESSAGDELANVAGEVTLDGVDIWRLRLKWLHAQMGLVSQEPAMFAMSVRENILFGEEDATGEEVVAAAMAANAHNFISQLPQGYDTQVTTSLMN